MVRALIIASILFFSGRAEATYSIAAVDTATMEVGGSGTSCVGNFSVSVIYGSVPGAGVVHAQAFFNQAGRNRAVELIGSGSTPMEIITEITSPNFDFQAESRQYGVVTIDGASAGFTGTDNGVFAGDNQGTVDTFSYTAQGNILTSENVIINASAAFEGSGCDLADRLMLALEAGAMNGEGDSRCTPDGIPSDGAFIIVDRPNDPGWLDIRVDDTAPNNPITMLRAEFDVWRMTHPCAPDPPPLDAGVPDSGDDPDTGVGFPDAEVVMDSNVVDDSGSTEPKDAGSGADAGQVADSGSTEEEEDDGCGCSATQRSEARLGWLYAIALAALLRRRRRVPG